MLFFTIRNSFIFFAFSTKKQVKNHVKKHGATKNNKKHTKIFHIFPFSSIFTRKFQKSSLLAQSNRNHQKTFFSSNRAYFSRYPDFLSFLNKLYVFLSIKAVISQNIFLFLAYLSIFLVFYRSFFA